MATYNVRLDMPIDAETPEKAALTMLSWLQDTSDPLLPVVEVMDLDATATIEEFDLSDFEQDAVPSWNTTRQAPLVVGSLPTKWPPRQ